MYFPSTSLTTSRLSICKRYYICPVFWSFLCTFSVYACSPTYFRPILENGEWSFLCTLSVYACSLTYFRRIMEWRERGSLRNWISYWLFNASIVVTQGFQKLTEYRFAHRWFIQGYKHLQKTLLGGRTNGRECLAITHCISITHYNSNSNLLLGKE